jgi:hypothetical protein
LAISFTGAAGQNLQPLDAWSKKNPNWAKDRSELAYVSTRCGVVFLAIGMYFSGNSGKIDDVNSGEELKRKGRALSLLGIRLSTQTGMSNDAIRERMAGLMNIYSSEIKLNKQLNNNIFYGWIEKDFDFCIELQQAVENLTDSSGK